MLTANIPQQTLKQIQNRCCRNNQSEVSVRDERLKREENKYSGSPAHKVPRRSEQVSHEKDMFRFRYGADFSHFPSRALKVSS